VPTPPTLGPPPNASPPIVQPVSDQADAESTAPEEPGGGKNLKPLYVLIIPFVGVAGYFMYKHRIHHNKLEAGGKSALPAAPVTLHSDINQQRKDPSSASIPADEAGSVVEPSPHIAAHPAKPLPGFKDQTSAQDNDDHSALSA